MENSPRNSLIRNKKTSAEISRNRATETESPEHLHPKRNLQKRIINLDKENMAANQNIQQRLQQNKSPKIKKNSPKQLLICSPDKPVYMPSGFRSNKANQCIIDIDEKLAKVDQVTTIYSGMSKDGRYQILSKAFVGKELQKARIFQIKTTNKFRQKNDQTYLSPEKIPKVEKSKTSNKQNGLIRSYAVNTHEGITRNYNEDRVSVILNINKNGVKSTFFAIYDGHGGTGCCDFLRDYLHQYIINHQSFPADPQKAIVEGIHRVQAKFIELVKKKFQKTNQLDRSGSCAILVVIVGNQCYTVNVGDSRAFLSKKNGKIISHLSRDHKPSDEKQQKRIISNGGKIYRTEMTKIDKIHVQNKQTLNENELIIGPLRVYPGKLSVTRTLGDIEAKDTDFQGIPNCVSFQPEIAKFTLNKNDDFLFLGCDGIFQKLQSVEVSKIIWKTIHQSKDQSIHKISGKCVDEVMKQAMRRKSSDNLTAILINLKDQFASLTQESSLMRNASLKSL